MSQVLDAYPLAQKIHFYDITQAQIKDVPNIYAWGHYRSIVDNNQNLETI